MFGRGIHLFTVFGFSVRLDPSWFIVAVIATSNLATQFFPSHNPGLPRSFGRYQLLDNMTDWSIQIFRSIPAISLIPLAILFLGIGDKPAIALIFLAGTWPLLINTIFGVRGIERTLIKVARAARASEFLVMKDIILPASMPAIFTGLRLAVGGGWLTVVTAEMIAVKSGLGYMILNAQLTFRSDLIIAGIIVIGGIGLLADQMVRRVRAHVCRWQEGLTAQPE